MAEAHESALKALYPSHYCDRSIKNAYYQSRALSALRSTCDSGTPTEEAIKEICDRFPCFGKPEALKSSVLAELGRIDDQDVIVELACELCDLSLSAKDAVILIRQRRLGVPEEGDVLQLYGEIANTINIFWKRFPKTPTSTVINALEMLRTNIEESENEGEESTGR